MVKLTWSKIRQAERPWPEWDRELDPELWDDHEQSFIEPGWAGVLLPGQAEYIRGVILRKIPNRHRRSDIRSWWGFRRGSGHYVSGAAIREVAMWGDPDDKEHNARLVAQVTERERAKGAGENATTRPGVASTSTQEGTTTSRGRVVPPQGVTVAGNAGVTKSGRGRPRNDGVDGEIADLAEVGWSARRIGTKLGVSRMTVARRLKRQESLF